MANSIKPTDGGMEYLADLLDLADGTGQHGGADAPSGDQVREAVALLTH